MAKQRNSLGMIVLPVPYEQEMTWEEYKSKYGIDLDRLFEVGDVGEQYIVRFKGDNSKIIVLALDGIGWENIRAYPSVFLPIRYTLTDSETLGQTRISFTVADNNGNSGYMLNINGDKTISGGEI